MCILKDSEACLSNPCLMRKNTLLGYKTEQNERQVGRSDTHCACMCAHTHTHATKYFCLIVFVSQKDASTIEGKEVTVA
jgi:hypothetical protein